MSKVIKVCHHSKTIGFAGTDRVAQLFCKYLKEMDGVEPYLVYREGDDTSRLDIVREMLGDDHVIPYSHTHKKNARPPYLPESDNLAEVLAAINPDIFHIHRSGYPEWPGVREVVPAHTKIVETNIFGYSDLTKAIDANIYISDHIRNSALRSGNPDGPVIYNPTERRIFRDDLPLGEAKAIARNELIEVLYKDYGVEIPGDAILVGRVGRADNFDPIALKAFSKATEANPEKDVWYLVVNGCERWVETAAELGITNIVFIDPIIDDEELSRFYSALDIYAHARHDGECCPCNIQEAMMHGVPIISHVSQMYNGQAEIIGDVGFVAPLADTMAYADFLDQLINDDEARKKLNVLVLRRAMRHFEASCITSGLAKVYEWVMDN